MTEQPRTPASASQVEAADKVVTRAALAALARARTALLTTYRRTGAPVGTPVHIAVVGDHAVVRTYEKAGKLKRIRRNPAVLLAPSTVRGRPLGPAIRGDARVLTGDEGTAAARALGRKYPVLQGVLIPWYHRLRGYPTVHLAVTPIDSAPADAPESVDAADGTKLRPLRLVAARRINPLTRRLAGWLPGFALLTHVGRRSGRTYRTPINIFRQGDDYYMALTFGPDVDWVRNVRAAGEAQIRSRGRNVRLVAPELIVDPDLRVLPVVPRVIERWNRATALMRMRAGS